MSKRALLYPFAHKRLNLRLFGAGFLRGTSDQNAVEAVDLPIADRFANLAARNSFRNTFLLASIHR